MSLMKVCDVCGKTMTSGDEFCINFRSKVGHFLSASIRVEDTQTGMGSWDICSGCVMDALIEKGRDEITSHR